MQVFTSPAAVPLGLMKLFSPVSFPYELLTGEIDNDLDIDLLSMYVQLSNPLLIIINPPESPDRVVLDISAQSIKIQDENGNKLPLESIPGQGSFSVSHTPLLPPPVFSIQTGWDNIYIGLGLFAGTSGLTLYYDDNFEAMLSEGEIKSGDSASFGGMFSSRAGLFQYVNLFTDPIYIFNDLELEVAGRLFIYEILAEVNASVNLDLKISEDYLLSDLETDTDLFYYYPGTGYGIGARLDFGSVLKYRNWSFGLSILNLLGVEYSEGFSLKENIYVETSNFYAPFRPALYVQASYFMKINETLTIIPVFDFGYAKNLFTRAALAVFWNNLSFKAGIAYEERMKGAFGAGIKTGCFSIESGIVLQQTLFNDWFAGIFLSAGFMK